MRILKKILLFQHGIQLTESFTFIIRAEHELAPAVKDFNMSAYVDDPVIHHAAYPAFLRFRYSIACQLYDNPDTRIVYSSKNCRNAVGRP